MAELQEEIINAVDSSIESFVTSFVNEPTRFFTENDLVCCFHRHLHNTLDQMGVATVLDKNKLPSSLVHCEYPTPFRCDMKKRRFIRKDDEERTEGGGKFKRGHYDIVVFNPEFIGCHSYLEIKGQKYSDFLRVVIPKMTESESAVLYGVELVFSRAPIPKSNGNEAAMAFVADVLQDTAKLTASIAMPGFMKKAAMLAFTKGTSDEVVNIIRNSLQCVPIARLIHA